MVIWASKQECMPRREIEELQVKRLRATLLRVYESVPFYRGQMDEAGAKPQDIRSLRDMRNLPFTTKADLRGNYPFGMLAAPLEEVRKGVLSDVEHCGREKSKPGSWWP